jgi:hypothetical protein
MQAGVAQVKKKLVYAFHLEMSIPDETSKYPESYLFNKFYFKEKT